MSGRNFLYVRAVYPMFPPQLTRPHKSACTGCYVLPRPDDYLTDDSEAGTAGGKPKRGSAAMAAANAIASLADGGGGGGRGGGGGAAEWAGVAGRGPPVAPRCDYVVDKVLGRKVFMVPVSGGGPAGTSEGTGGEVVSREQENGEEEGTIKSVDQRGRSFCNHDVAKPGGRLAGVVRLEDGS